MKVPWPRQEEGRGGGRGGEGVLWVACLADSEPED